jgi:hypothetical protein
MQRSQPPSFPIEHCMKEKTTAPVRSIVKCASATWSADFSNLSPRPVECSQNLALIDTQERPFLFKLRRIIYTKSQPLVPILLSDSAHYSNMKEIGSYPRVLRSNTDALLLLICLLSIRLLLALLIVNERFDGTFCSF